mgnify:CR=1 FL=1
MSINSIIVATLEATDDNIAAEIINANNIWVGLLPNIRVKKAISLFASGVLEKADDKPNEIITK